MVRTMPQIRRLIPACALLVSLGSAQATTFDVAGTYYSSPTFYGTLTIDANAGKVTGVNIIFPGIANFTNLGDSAPSFNTWYIRVKNPSLTAELTLVFSTPNPGTLV